ncbi:hypothetical protein lerEdw1_003622 [Lerista edwardsae]|nr:hypothetical protein lerEdw1_003622 [Lerista edwardsae]
MSGDDELNLLVVIVDTNPIWWGKQALGGSELTLSQCLDAVMVLGNSHLFMNRNNKLAVIASHIQESRFLYPGKHWAAADLFGEVGESNISGSKDGKYELLTNINDTIAIEVIKAAEDSALQYMNFMNVIFAAQKQNILIDACILDSDSGLLQQCVYLPEQEQRSQLILPPPVHVDYRAACFCHRNLIEIGYVCSVCLSIFCTFSPICTTCETAFKISLPAVMKAKKKKLKLAS